MVQEPGVWGPHVPADATLLAELTVLSLRSPEEVRLRQIRKEQKKSGAGDGSFVAASPAMDPPKPKNLTSGSDDDDDTPATAAAAAPAKQPLLIQPTPAPAAAATTTQPAAQTVKVATAGPTTPAAKDATATAAPASAQSATPAQPATQTPATPTAAAVTGSEQRRGSATAANAAAAEKTLKDRMRALAAAGTTSGMPSTLAAASGDPTAFGCVNLHVFVDGNACV